MTWMQPSRNGKPINSRWEEISNEAAELWAIALNFHNHKFLAYEDNENRNLPVHSTDNAMTRNYPGGLN
jgi:hypothetical protein